MGWIDNNCSVTKCNDNNNPYYCTTPVGNNVSTCIRNGECTPVGMSPTSCNVDARCGGRNTPNPTPTPTQCINIIAYKDGNALSQAELNALSPGNTITLAFAPGGAATKVRFRVNSGTWSQTTTKNANGQFIWNYTLENVTNFIIEAQWFDGSVWH
jgi:hypothetical protein